MRLRKLSKDEIKQCRNMKKFHKYETYKNLLIQIFHPNMKEDDW
jgi:hypothetical protein